MKKLNLYFLKRLILACIVLAPAAVRAEAEEKPASAQTKKTPSALSFRPLLIQGKKRMIQKNKDMKLETGNIAESELFFIDIDFKGRIFEGLATEE